MAFKSQADVQRWVDEKGGIDGGGFDALQNAIHEGVFAPEGLAHARTFTTAETRRRALANKDALALSLQQVAAKNRAREEASAREARQADLERQAEVTELTRRGVAAAEDQAVAAQVQADAAREAVKVSRIAGGLSLLALIVSLIALVKQLHG